MCALGHVQIGKYSGYFPTYHFLHMEIKGEMGTFFGALFRVLPQGTRHLSLEGWLNLQRETSSNIHTASIGE
jgi:hypothetical protein